MTRRWLVVAAITPMMVGCGVNPPGAATEISVENTCSHRTEHGMGFTIDNGLVLTSAHVVAGATDIELSYDTYSTGASIVAFDPDNDLAYLRPDRANATGWPLASTATLDEIERDTPGSVYVVRDGALTRLDVTVVRRVNIDTEDIYIEGQVSRPGWELAYPIEPGDSGAAVVVDGEIVGVVWARSRRADERAYAIDPVSARGLLDAQLTAGNIDVADHRDIDLERC